MNKTPDIDVSAAESVDIRGMSSEIVQGSKGAGDLIPMTSL